MSEAEEEAIEVARQRGRSKRWDERVKLAANFLNGTGIATLIVSLISPFMQGVDVFTEGHALVGVIIALTFHGIGQMALGLVRGD